MPGGRFEGGDKGKGRRRVVEWGPGLESGEGVVRIRQLCSWVGFCRRAGHVSEAWVGNAVFTRALHWMD